MTDDARPVKAVDESVRASLETHHRAAYAWALSCCAFNSVEAENVLQSVYVKILQGSATFGGGSAFRTWLFGVVRNTAAEERRRRLWQCRWVVSDDAELESAFDDDDPVERVYRAELQSRIRSAVARLPARQREVLMLVFYYEMTLDEAAAVMGVSRGAASRHYDRGKRRLREWLANAGIHDESTIPTAV
jgi:RNA polymerase sigma-70 factor (ECF subfamily)